MTFEEFFERRPKVVITDHTDFLRVELIAAKFRAVFAATEEGRFTFFHNWNGKVEEQKITVDQAQFITRYVGYPPGMNPN